MLIKCDILKYTLLFSGRTIWALCKLLNACWSPLEALLHCLVPSTPLSGHNSSSNKYRVIISARNVSPERGLPYFCCMCVLERKAYYNIKPLCFPSFNTHWFCKMSLAITTPFAFVPFTNIFHLSPISYLQLLSVLLWKATVPKW